MTRKACWILSQGLILTVPLGEVRLTAEDFHHDGSLKSVRRENIVRVLRETGGVLAGPRGSSGAAGSEKDNVVFQN